MSNNNITSYETIITIIRKIFDDYDEKNGALQKIDYTKRATAIVDTWQKAMNGKGLTTELICELHRLVCNHEDIAIHDEQGNIIGYTKAGEYRTHPSSRKSELHKGKRTLFLPPEQIPQRMEYLVSTMNSLFDSNQSNEVMIENIIAFTVEFLTVHPFANQNGRIAQVLMELFAFQANIEPFYISYVVKTNYSAITKSAEEVLLHGNVAPFLSVMNKIKSLKGTNKL